MENPKIHVALMRARGAKRDRDREGTQTENRCGTKCQSSLECIHCTPDILYIYLRKAIFLFFFSFAFCLCTRALLFNNGADEATAAWWLKLMDNRAIILLLLGFFISVPLVILPPHKFITLYLYFGFCEYGIGILVQKIEDCCDNC